MPSAPPCLVAWTHEDACPSNTALKLRGEHSTTIPDDDGIPAESGSVPSTTPAPSEPRQLEALVGRHKHLYDCGPIRLATELPGRRPSARPTAHSSASAGARGPSL